MNFIKIDTSLIENWYLNIFYCKTNLNKRNKLIVEKNSIIF